MAQNKKGLGRGLAALIPIDEMDLLSSIARGELSLLTDSASIPDPPAAVAPADQHKNLSPADSKRATTPRRTSPPRRTTTSPQQEPPPAQVSASVIEDGQAQAASLPDETTAPLNAATSTAISQSTTGQDNAPIAEVSALIEWLSPQQIGANPYQPRRTFDVEELSNLTESVREHGILQPIIVRPWPQSPAPAGTTGAGAARKETEAASIPPFQLIAGERRWRASQAAGLNKVPVVIREVSDQQALELAVIENVQRHDISPLDAALAYRRLSAEFGLSQEKIALRVGKSRSSIANTQRLLELPLEAQTALQDGTLSEGHGRAILLAPGEGARRAAFRTILRDHLSVRDAEELARRIARENLETGSQSSDKTREQSSARTRDKNDVRAMDVNQMTEEIQQSTGCRVQFRARRKGGHFVIYCASDAQIEQITNLLRQGK